MPDVEAKLAIAHRGASGYAPEHTIEAYRLAVEQGADFIEPDLQITRDGVLICLHDLTLERTTDVEDVFPERYREETERGDTVRHWYASDFTLEEVRRLDAGSWFDERFRGARVPTFAEAIDVAVGHAGIFPETKAPEVYGSQGFEMERLLVEQLARRGLAAPGANADTPVVIQSFSEESLRILREELGSELPLVFLVSEVPSGSDAAAADSPLSPDELKRIAGFATGIGPAKRLLIDEPRIVGWAHDAGLTVVPWTFRADNPGGFADVREEMAHFLYDLGVDALFTNNPDLFPREAAGRL